VPAKRHPDKPDAQKKTDKDLAENHFGKGIGGELKAEKERDQSDEEKEGTPEDPIENGFFFGGGGLHIVSRFKRNERDQ
jgi:hypothetical protein